MNTWEQDLERLYEILKDRCHGCLKCHRCLIAGLRVSMALWVSFVGRSHPSGNAQLESERHAEGHLRWKGAMLELLQAIAPVVVNFAVHHVMEILGGQVWSESPGSCKKADP